MISPLILREVSQLVEEQLKKMYKEYKADFYVWCDLMDYYHSQVNILRMGFVVIGTSDFHKDEFRKGFEIIAKQAGLDWRVHEWGKILDHTDDSITMAGTFDVELHPEWKKGQVRLKGI